MIGIIFLSIYSISLIFSLELPNFSDILTVLSINLGFYLTALSVIYKSNFSQKLAQEIDKERKHNSKLKVLTNYFSFSVKNVILDILSILFFQIIDEKTVELLEMQKYGSGNELTEKILFILSACQKFLSPLILALTVINFLLVFLIFRIFLNSFILEARSGE